MKTEHGKIEGDLRVGEEFSLFGMVRGSVFVAPQATLHLYGMMCSNLYLEPGSRVEISGMVSGTVVNQGGSLRVFGMVKGGLRHESGETVVHPKAVIKGRIIGPIAPLEESS